MKKTNIIVSTLLLLALTEVANAQDTVTDIGTAYDRPESKGGSEDVYGNKILYQTVDITKSNYSVDNFWSNFKGDNHAKSTFNNISTSGMFELTVEETFACKDGGLKVEGCSGQKPFLVNASVLDNEDTQKDSVGADLPEGEYRIPYDSADNYDKDNNDAFYALDVYRDMDYYRDEAIAATEGRKSFFGYIKDLFTNYFSPDTEQTGSVLNQGENDAKDRYMANMVFGLQKDYRVQKNDPLDLTHTNAANSSKNISLLDYNAQMITSTTSCSGFFLSFDPDSVTCQTISFFGMANWMPFFSDNSSQEIETQSVMQDTETTLLTIAGKLDGKNYITNYTSIDEHGRRSFVGEIFKPMTSMMGGMFRFFFGNSSRTTTEVVSANFTFDNPAPLSFVTTDGSSVIGFEKFKLLGLESVYGTVATSCRVKQKTGFFNLWSGYRTFVKGDGQETKIDMEGGGFFSFLSSTPDYDELNYEEENHRSFGDWGRHDVVTVTSDDWIDWCKRNQGRQRKGLFGRMFDNFNDTIDYLLNKDNTLTGYDEQLDGVLSDEHYTVDKYKEKVYHGLILHVQKTSSEDIKVGTVGTTTSYKLMNVNQGNTRANTHGNTRGNGQGGKK